MNTLANLLRTVALTVIALVGLAMAAIFLVSTAIALGVLYVVARLRGRPFVPNAAWQRSQTRWGFGGAANAGPAAGLRRNLKRADIIEVEVRDI